MEIGFAFISDVDFQSYRYDHCVVCPTATMQPYIDMVAPSLGVAIGGCGYAAKSSDEIGRVAARFVQTLKTWAGWLI